MSKQQTLDQVLAILHTIKDDEGKLAYLLEWMEEQFREENILEEILAQDDHLEQVPERYRKAIKEIAENMAANLISYFNPDTLELESVYNSECSGLFDEEDEEEMGEDTPYKNWEKCIEIEPPGSSESFCIMERFVKLLPDDKAAGSLTRALNGKKPFADFNHQIHNSKYREQWFDFRQKDLEKYVVYNYFYDPEEQED